MITFRYTKTLKDNSCINDFENEFGYKFDISFVNCVKVNNGGRPLLKMYNTDRASERTIKKLLSFNKTDDENIWTANKFLKKINNTIIAFAMDSFGNYICFSKDNGSVMFFEQETETVEKITDSFDEFLANLF